MSATSVYSGQEYVIEQLVLIIVNSFLGPTSHHALLGLGVEAVVAPPLKTQLIRFLQSTRLPSNSPHNHHLIVQNLNHPLHLICALIPPTTITKMSTLALPNPNPLNHSSLNHFPLNHFPLNHFPTP